MIDKNRDDHFLTIFPRVARNQTPDQLRRFFDECKALQGERFQELGLESLVFVAFFRSFDKERVDKVARVQDLIELGGKDTITGGGDGAAGLGLRGTGDGVSPSSPKIFLKNDKQISPTLIVKGLSI